MPHYCQGDYKKHAHSDNNVTGLSTPDTEFLVGKKLDIVILQYYTTGKSQSIQYHEDYSALF